jgi:ADP-ribose pyrophosphatase YjhB (NUDIX family)
VKVPRVRPLAIAIIARQGRILVSEGYDSVKRETFFRPLGGGIEFGELATAALARELREEIGAEITGATYLGLLENIFTCDGEPGHEIVLVFAARFADPDWYERAEIPGREDDGQAFRTAWMSLADFAPGHAPLYPAGLAELLKGYDDAA